MRPWSISVAMGSPDSHPLTGVSRSREDGTGREASPHRDDNLAGLGAAFLGVLHGFAGLVEGEDPVDDGADLSGVEAG